MSADSVCSNFKPTLGSFEELKVLDCLVVYGAEAWCLKRWIPNPLAPAPKPLGGSKANSISRSNKYQEIHGS